MWATGPVLHLSMLVATFLMISLRAGLSLLSELGTLSVSKVCRGIARKIVNQEVNLPQQEERSGLGLCPCSYGGLSFASVSVDIDPDRPIIYKQWFALSACSQCELPLFMLQPCMSSLRTVWCSSSAGWLPMTTKRTNPHCRYGLRLFVWPARMIFNIYCWL